MSLPSFTPEASQRSSAFLRAFAADERISSSLTVSASLTVKHTDS